MLRSEFLPAKARVTSGRHPSPSSWAVIRFGHGPRTGSVRDVHKLPADLRLALTTDAPALDAWRHITPLARNEWICWVESAQRDGTREHRIDRTHTELTEGRRRPRCWPGCSHPVKHGK